MCWGGGADSTMTIKSKDPNVSLEDKAKEYGLDDKLKQPPPPSLTDEAVEKVRKAAMLRMLQGQGRSSTFLTGPGGAMDNAKYGGASLSYGDPSLLGG